MAKKKKAPKAPKLVAPEPPGDEWEANMAWNRVAHAGAPPTFFNGAHVAATDNVFGVRYDVEQPSPAPGTGLTSSGALTAAPDATRAVDVYVRAEKALREARERQREASEAVDGFQLLQEAEKQHTAREKVKLEEAWAAALRDLDAGEAATLETMETLSDTFFRVMDAAKQRVLDLVIKDADVEEAFAEREATLQHCQEVTDAYYTEHAAHVRTIEQLQADTAREHEEELVRMTETLQDTAFELLVMASQHDNTEEIQQRRSELLVELQRLQERTPQTLREHKDATSSTGALRRLVELEEQKLALALQRQAALTRAVQTLSEAAEADAGTSMAVEAPRANSTALLAVEPAFDDGEDGSLNEVVAQRRALDQTTRDLAAAQERLQHLQNYHLVQLSGAYKPVSMASVGTDGGANNLDEETNAAIRSVVMTSMSELAASAHAASGGAAVVDPSEPSPFLVPPAETIEDRLAVQNYIARQINKLLAGQVPTAPPMTLLSATPPASETA